MVQEISIVVDVDKMELEDLVTLEDAAQMKTGSLSKFLDLVERVATVEGIENIRKLPIRHLNVLVEAMADAVNEAAEGEEGNSDSG
jgi:hypothetical protein